jgi:hypothetical protein
MVEPAAGATDVAPGDETTGDTLTLADIARIRARLEALESIPNTGTTVYVIPSGYATSATMHIINGLRSTGAHVVLQAEIPASTRRYFGNWEGMRIRESPRLPNAKPQPSRPWVRPRAEQWRNNRKRQR